MVRNGIEAGTFVFGSGKGALAALPLMSSSKAE
jgi:hypothetical protein